MILYDTCIFFETARCTYIQREYIERICIYIERENYIKRICTYIERDLYRENMYIYRENCTFLLIF